MRKLALVAMITILALVIPASPAASGGWWSYINARPSLVAPGMTVRVARMVTFSPVREKPSTPT